ncbi:MAG: glucose-6-phosphate isomerase [Lentisphaeria bacterium]|nr:glucose-6-phosphate isomerase [Lentisphaeria bacterium]
MNAFEKRSLKYTLSCPETDFSINFAGMKFTGKNLDDMAPLFKKAAKGIADIESGKIKNPDEKRKVTHFTDRIAYAESKLFQEVEAFAADIRSGKITGATGKKFDAVVINGIGGSALGPQLMQFAINGPYYNEWSAKERNGNLRIYFLDNTDAAGFVDMCKVCDPETTLHLCISKSGGTQETKNNLIATENLYASLKLDFAKHACAITMKDSSLDQIARSGKWLKVFEMAESIGGRTSETSIVGHLPAVLCGIDFKSFIAGACAMDEWTRSAKALENPAMMLAAMWYIAGKGKGNRNMVIVPYSDRLVLLSRYLQQLVMESLGKEFDLDGKKVHQGLNVFGNKGGTDAHAFIQQLNDGRDDFFATFIEVLKDAEQLKLGEMMFMGDYLHGFMEGLTLALRSKKRQIISVKISEINTFNLGMLIALYERAVAVYAEFININAFHQPGVHAYKLAAKGVLAMREKVLAVLAEAGKYELTAAEIAAKAGLNDNVVEVGNLMDKISFNCPKVNRKYVKNKKCFVYFN